MAGLRLGPLLRYVDWESGSTATVWVEASRPCTVEVRCADGASGASPTFSVAGHHYALVVVEGLTPGSTTAYEVLIGSRRVWPPEDTRLPPSTITTPPAATPAGPGKGAAESAGASSDGVRISFGSCRWAAAPGG
ncbi:alkaline phosphatase family protein, partial [Streptomyces parvus]|nr:alkaline phosphatase family protein [Streptomyces parvus]